MNVCQGKVKLNGTGDFKSMKEPRDLYIITTAKKRDSLEWQKELASFGLSPNIKCCVNVIIDSWNNIKKYKNIKFAFFIFDEQRLIGSGQWVKSFLKIAKTNKWILLSATPGDTWMDYIPVFVANGFYKNKTELLREHAVYSRFTKYPSIERFINERVLLKYRDSITCIMEYTKHTISNHKTIITMYDQMKYKDVMKNRWDPYKSKPIKTAAELCYVLRKVCNSNEARLIAIKEIINDRDKVIIFYNFDYELELLRTIEGIPIAEWNGHKHESVPNGDRWLYLVQYTAGAEGWNCVETNTIVFYSQTYSYKTLTQAAGRIDRLNTKFVNLYYYHLRCSSYIDIAISIALKNKKSFNALKFDSHK